MRPDSPMERRNFVVYPKEHWRKAVKKMTFERRKEFQPDERSEESEQNANVILKFSLENDIFRPFRLRNEGILRNYAVLQELVTRNQ